MSHHRARVIVSNNASCKGQTPVPVIVASIRGTEVPLPRPHRHQNQAVDSRYGIHPNMANTVQFPGYLGRSSRRAHTTPNSLGYYSSTPSTIRQSTVYSTPRTVSCAVCFDSDVRFPSTTPTKRCTHKSNVCTDCLSGHIRAAVMGSGHTTVRCPSANCTAELAYEDVCTAARDKALVERYDSLLLRQALGSDTSFVWCKNTACGSGQFHPDGDSAPIVTCRRCGTKSCFQHDVIWHAGFTCSEYDAHLRPVNMDTADYLTKYTKVCPHCTRMVQKIDGCDHMVCARPGGCGKEFCWACLADYAQIRSYGNSRHNTGCPHRGGGSYEYDSD